VKFKATQPVGIISSTVVIAASNSTVQEYAVFSIDFQCPIPLSAGTIITVVFPANDFSFDSSRLTQVQGFGLFGSLSDLRFAMDESQRSIKISNGIESYRQANITGKIIIS
jgi:hypothetical protein